MSGDGGEVSQHLLTWFAENYELTPHHAIDTVSRRCGLARELSIASLSMKLSTARIMAIVNRVAGHTTEGATLKILYGPQYIPPELWDNEAFYSPASTLWTTGDLRAFLPFGAVVLSDIRLESYGANYVCQEIKGPIIDRDEAVPISTPSSIAPVSSTSAASKWDWDAAFAKLVSLANTPDGLSGLPGFDYPKRGSQAALERWFVEFFDNEGSEAPSLSEIRKRASRIMLALADGPKGFSKKTD